MRRDNWLLFEAILSAGVFSTLLGCCYLFGPDATKSTAALSAVKSAAPLWVWGSVFVIVGVAVIGSAFTTWTTAAYAMFATAGLFVAWAFGFGWSAYRNDGTGMVGALFATAAAYNKILFGRACVREASR